MKKHILILTPGFPQNETDATCIPALQALVKELQTAYGNCLHISVVAFQYPFQRGYYRWNGIECWSAGGKNRRFLGKVVTWTRVSGFIYSLNKKNPVHVIHSFWLHDCTLLGHWAAQLTGARHLAHVMGQDVLAANPYIRFLNRNKLLVIANSPFSANLLKREFDWSAYCIVPFGIDPDDFQTESGSSRKIDLLAVGSLTAVKNHELFVEIFAALKNYFPGLTGRIIGDGPLKEILLEQIHRLGLADCLHLEGAKSRKEVLARMSDCKILLHTAAFESAAYVFLEALYSGMKVVSFRTGFIPDVKSAFQCIDREALFQQLLKLLNEQQHYERVEVPEIAETASAIFRIYSEGRVIS